jgi:hypothetical protein
MVLSEARIAAKLKVKTNVIRNEVIVWRRQQDDSDGEREGGCVAESGT